MSLGLLLAGIWLFLVGLEETFGIAVPSLLTGILALVAGVLLVLDAAGVYRRSI